MEVALQPPSQQLVWHVQFSSIMKIEALRLLCINIAGWLLLPVSKLREVCRATVILMGGYVASVSVCVREGGSVEGAGGGLDFWPSRPLWTYSEFWPPRAHPGRSVEISMCFLDTWTAALAWPSSTLLPSQRSSPLKLYRRQFCVLFRMFCCCK